jgi:hypothetical protein
MATENRSELIVIRVTPSLKKVLEEMAHRDERPVSSMVFKLLNRLVREEHVSL